MQNSREQFYFYSILLLIVMVFWGCEDDSNSNTPVSVTVNIGEDYLDLDQGNTIYDGRTVLSSNQRGVFLDTTIFAGNSYVLNSEDTGSNSSESIDLTFFRTYINGRGNEIKRLTTLKDINQMEISFLKKDSLNYVGSYYLTIEKDIPFSFYSTSNIDRYIENNTDAYFRLRFDFTESERNLFLLFYNQVGDAGKYYYNELSAGGSDTILASSLVDIEGVPFIVTDDRILHSLTIFGNTANGDRVKLYKYDDNAFWPEIGPTMLIPNDLFVSYDYFVRTTSNDNFESRYYNSNEILTDIPTVLNAPEVGHGNTNEFYIEETDEYEFYKASIGFSNAPIFNGDEVCLQWIIYGKLVNQTSLELDEIVNLFDSNSIDILCNEPSLDVSKAEVFRLDEIDQVEYEEFLNSFTDKNSSIYNICNSMEAIEL